MFGDAEVEEEVDADAGVLEALPGVFSLWFRKRLG
jgi:hypothetical protein